MCSGKPALGTLISIKATNLNNDTIKSVKSPIPVSLMAANYLDIILSKMLAELTALEYSQRP